MPGGVGLDADRRATNLGEDGASLTAAFLADALALDLIVPGTGALASSEGVLGRKAKLLARDRGVRVRAVESRQVERACWQPGPLRRLAGGRAVPA